MKLYSVIGTIVIPQVDEVKFLGVTFVQNMSLDVHTESEALIIFIFHRQPSVITWLITAKFYHIFSRIFLHFV